MRLLRRIGVLILVLTLGLFLTGCELQANPTKTEATSTQAKNVYELALEDGFQGSLDEWFLSLLENGSYNNLYDLAVEEGLFNGTLEEFIASLKGSDGKTSIVSSAQTSLLSTVSIFCTFTITTSYSNWPFGGRTQTQVSQATSAGSGVIYLTEDDGTAYIITNYHVLYYKNADSQISDDIYVYLYGMEYTDYQIEATYVGGSMAYDIAVIKVKSDYLKKDGGYPYKAVTLGDSKSIQVGESVLAVGNPEAEGLSVTNGIISVKSETLEMYLADGKTVGTIRVLRIDAAVNSGNSGGGLYNDNGELIGIVNAKSVDEEIEGMCYAIPVNLAKSIADNIIENCNGSSSTTIKRVYLGITTKISSSRAYYDETSNILSTIQEIAVESVKSSGDSYGILQVGDVIINATFNNKTYIIDSAYALEDVLLNARKGDTIDLYILRSDEYKTVTIKFQSDTTIE